MTVDWSNWMNLTPQQQEAIWRRYRDIVKAESDQARVTNCRTMQDAMTRVRV